MKLVLSVNKGDPSALLQVDNDVLNKKDPQGKKDNFYHALLGLQYYIRRDKNDFEKFNTYLQTLDSKMGSNQIILGELLAFFITAKRKNSLFSLLISIASETNPNYE